MYEEYDELEMPEVNGALMARLSLSLNLDSNASKFFKNTTHKHIVPNPMSLEIDTIRKHEGW